MTLQASGPITFAQVNVEIGNAATASLGLNDNIVRAMAGANTAGSAVAMNMLYGKNKGFAATLTIAANTQNYNIRTAAIAAGWDGNLPATINLVVNAGVYVGSTSTGTYALTTGTFPAGSVVTITNNGNIQGCGGAGGIGGRYNGHGGAGGAGGPAISMNYSVTIINNGVIGGGGGGGGGGKLGTGGSETTEYYPGGGGGGGRGYNGGGAGASGGSGAANGGAGSLTAAGSGGNGASGGGGRGGNGGALGTAGAAGGAASNYLGYNAGAGGGAGVAIARNGNTITWGGSVGSGVSGAVT